jgi:hypothetical protein
MYPDTQIESVQNDLERIFTAFITRKIPFFEVLKKEYLPEGLKPHTRSICWLAEQVILQNVRKHREEFGIIDFAYPTSDISPWDAKFVIPKSSGAHNVFINIKVTDSAKPIRKNDIASVKALLHFYRDNPDPLLYFVVIRLKFEDNIVRFVEPVTARYYPWVKDFVVNPRNEHVQSVYETLIERRSSTEFISLLKQKATEKGLDIA